MGGLINILFLTLLSHLMCGWLYKYSFTKFANPLNVSVVLLLFFSCFLWYLIWCVGSFINTLLLILLTHCVCGWFYNFSISYFANTMGVWVLLYLLYFILCQPTGCVGGFINLVLLASIAGSLCVCGFYKHSYNSFLC